MGQLRVSQVVLGLFFCTTKSIVGQKCFLVVQNNRRTHLICATGQSCVGSRAKRVPEVDSSCRLLIVPLFRGSSRFASLVLSYRSRFRCECDKEDINDGDDDDVQSA